MKTTRRLFALLLVVCLLAGYAVVPAYAAGAAAISFGDGASRTSFSDEQQVWAANGLTVTVDKADATTNMYDNVAKGYGEIRIYNGATVKIEYPGMTKIVFNVDDYKDNYLPLFMESIASADCGTVTNEGNVVTLVLAEASDSVTYIARGTSQHRLEKIEVYTGDVSDGGSEEPTEPEVTEPEVTEPEVEATVETVADGTYVISTGAYTLAALAEDQNYGYAPAGDASAPADTDVVTITNVDGGFTMQDCYGRYLYMSGTYNSFNVSAEAPSEGHVWQLMNDGTNLYLVNVAKEKTLAYSTNYTSWGIYSSLKDTDLFALTVTAYEANEEPVPGESAENPLYPEWVWNEEYTEASVEITVPAGATYYVAITASGMEMTINGENAVTVNGSRWQAEIHTITNESAEKATYTLALSYPMGSQMNPEDLYMLGTQYAALEANDFDGYYYTYTADSDCTLKLSLVNVTEGVEADIIVTNQNSVQKTLTADGVDGVLTLEVAKDDVLTIQAVALPAADWTIPAATIFWDINYPAGTEQNPLFPEFQWNEEWTEATATVTVPANTTYYCASYSSGMILTINDGEEQLLTAQGMGRVPAYFNLVNDTDAAAEFKLRLTYPMGHQMNPEELFMLGTQYAALEADDFDGYYYTYTADSDCTLKFSLVNVTEGVEADIIVTNQNSVQKTLTADGADGVLTLEVAEGDILTIQVVALPAADWTIPAATIFWDINYPVGTELNPLFPEFVWNEEWTEADATVTVPANTTYYCASYSSGMILTINGGNEQLLTAQGMGRVPAYFTIVNDTDAAADYALHLEYPEGHQMNPEKVSKTGTLEVALEANDFDGYYYTVKAVADGTVEFSIASVTEGVEADIIVTNQDSVQKVLSADGVDGVLTLEVAKGDVLTVQVVVLPDMMWNYPAANVSVDAKLTYDMILGDVDGDGAIKTNDAKLILQHIVKMPVELNEAAGDVDGDGAIKTNDAKLILQYIVKIITKFPAEK